MDKKTKKNLIVSGGLILLFLVFTLVVTFVDVRPVGANGSEVGLATINQWFFNLLGVVELLDVLTDVFMCVAVGLVLVLAVVGVVQWVKRKSIKKVDKELVLFALCCCIMGCFYLLFEALVINTRPTAIDGVLEASYPSSHTLIICVVLGCALVLNQKKNTLDKYKKLVNLAISMFAGVAVICRLLSGMHWLTDIFAGVLLASGIVMFYYSCVNFKLAESAEPLENKAENGTM